MKYLNVGCGYHFSEDEIWTNIDFIKTGEKVINFNLLNGIPEEDNIFNLVYHSHVLEHFSKAEGFKFLTECKRVLVSEGIIRIAIPDLEKIVRSYLALLEKGMNNLNDLSIKDDYDWMLLEMYDQTVRNKSGGLMAEYLFKPELKNEQFVFERIGKEGENLRENFINTKAIGVTNESPNFLKRIKYWLKKKLRKNRIDNEYEKIGKFRKGGEIHQWMYDRYSLTTILRELGFKDVKIVSAFESKIHNWKNYNLDGLNDVVRKPDSLFIEAIKI